MQLNNQELIEKIAQHLIDIGGVSTWKEVNQFSYYEQIAKDIVNIIHIMHKE